MYPRERDGGIAAIVGTAGCGKTSLACKATRPYCGFAQVIIFDPTEDVGKYFASGHPDGIKPRGRIARVGTVAEVRELTKWGGRKPETIIFAGEREVFTTSRNGQKHGTLVTEFVTYVDAQRECVVFVDEADTVFPANMPVDCLANSVQTKARNRGYALILTTKRPADVSARVRGNALHVCHFRADSKQAVETGAKNFGEFDLYWPRVKTIPRFHYLYRGPFLENPDARLPEYDARHDPVPWLIQRHG